MADPAGAMTGLGLAASVIASITSLAWPGAFAWSVWLFRKELAELLPFLHVKKGETEAYFDKRLDQTEKEAKLLPKDGPVDELSVLTFDEIDAHYEELAVLSPRAAILEMRANLEQAVRELAKTIKVEGADNRSFLQLLREMRSKNFISDVHYSLIENLRSIGNSAAHNSAFTMTVEEAKRYGELTDKAVQAINGLASLFE